MHRWDWSQLTLTRLSCSSQDFPFGLLLFILVDSFGFGRSGSIAHFYRDTLGLSLNLDLIKKSPFRQLCRCPYAHHNFYSCLATVRCKGTHDYLVIYSGMNCLAEVVPLRLNRSSGLAAWNLMVVHRSCTWHEELCLTVHAACSIGGASQDWMHLTTLVDSRLVI